MKNPLMLVVPMLALSAVTASAQPVACQAQWQTALRPDDRNVQLPKLKPIAIRSCADVERLGAGQERFWKIRLALVKLPQGGVTAETLVSEFPDLKAATEAPDKKQFLSVGELIRINAILAGADLCDAATGGACS